jgi:hypothetical protein
MEDVEEETIAAKTEIQEPKKKPRINKKKCTAASE